MANTHFQGMPVVTDGNLPDIGSIAPAFTLIKNDLTKLSLKDLRGKKVILNIFPSLDTGVCAASVRRFNKEAASLQNTVVLCISRDLPFAQARFCGVEGIKNAITVSEYRNNEFSSRYGVMMKNGPLEGLFARCVVIIDEKGIVRYTQLVDEITTEPDYSAALASL
ncbi:MAG: thiol peroxidase [Bacteroidales bacterium]|nr:thiol peroxidase [Bacteroidales bacterium]MCI1785224.1 thiol peroxidase [Bacteroidales bacterium]